MPLAAAGMAAALAWTASGDAGAALGPRPPAYVALMLVIGLVGSWFVSCVISICRNVLKLLDSDVSALLPVDADVDADVEPAVEADVADPELVAPAAALCWEDRVLAMLMMVLLRMRK